MQLAMSHHQAGRLAEAERLYRGILAQFPEHPDATHFLGILGHQAGHADAALGLLRRSIELAPQAPQFRRNMAGVLRDLAKQAHARGELLQAMGLVEQSLAEVADDAETHLVRANTLKDLGQVQEGLAEYRRAIELRPDHPGPRSALLLALHLDVAIGPEQLFKEHVEFGQRFGQAGAAPPPPALPKRRIRVGYVSPDFRQHSVAFFIGPVLDHHDRSRFEICCYFNSLQADQITSHLRKSSEHWRDIAAMTDEQVEQVIRQDQIDILIDLAGHTNGNRLGVFARRPAPIQVTYLGYPDTTGLREIGYRITDPQADPPGQTEHLHTEKLLRLPEIFATFHPPSNAPPVAPLPSDSRGNITFASFSRYEKLTDAMLDLWAQVLQSVPQSRLIITAGVKLEPPMRSRLEGRFTRAGVSLDRVDVLQRLDFLEYLGLHGRVDIALDTFPFAGHTTTCHAFWMGVPIVTLAGVTHISRMGLTLLHNVGLADLAASSPEEYVRIAIALARDRARLVEIRSTLRGRMQNSALMDSTRFTRQLEMALLSLFAPAAA